MEFGKVQEIKLSPCLNNLTHGRSLADSIFQQSQVHSHIHTDSFHNTDDIFLHFGTGSLHKESAKKLKWIL